MKRLWNWTAKHVLPLTAIVTIWLIDGLWNFTMELLRVITDYYDFVVVGSEARPFP